MHSARPSVCGLEIITNNENSQSCRSRHTAKNSVTPRITWETSVVDIPRFIIICDLLAAQKRYGQTPNLDFSSKGIITLNCHHLSVNPNQRRVLAAFFSVLFPSLQRCCSEFQARLYLSLFSSCSSQTSLCINTVQMAQQQQQSCMDDFQAGVTACLRSWSALRTAVEGGWGGGTRESHGKAEELRRNILTVMDGRKCPPANFDVVDLADNLAIYMEEEFSVTLEDNSEQQVAETIFQMYEECFHGNATLARQLLSCADAAVTLTSQYPVKVQKSEYDDDDDDDDDEDMLENSVSDPISTKGLSVSTDFIGHGETPLASIALHYKDQPLFGVAPTRMQPTAPAAPVRQLGEAAAEPPPMEMDEDGFAPVQPKGRKKR
jgi:pre-rRNA-processing protein TSR2